jgi:ABC-2 type transport system permease protein
MDNTLAIFKKELKSYFNSPIAYIVITVFLGIAGWFFSAGLFLVNEASLRNVMGVIPLIFLFFIPAITMRLISEERKVGTIELILTMPLKEYEIILGKFLASLALLGIALFFTLAYTLTIAILGDPDGGPIFTGYIGLLLMGSAYLSMGIYASSITENQIVAFIVGFLIILVFFMLDKVLIFVPPSLSGILEYLSVDFHFNNIMRGVIDTRDIIYYLSLTAFGLTLASRALASGRRS